MRKKLTLKTEVVRRLTTDDMLVVVGGVTTDPPPSWQNTQCWNSWCGMCPLEKAAP
jgi:hypothetical protein